MSRVSDDNQSQHSQVSLMAGRHPALRQGQDGHLGYSYNAPQQKQEYSPDDSLSFVYDNHHHNHTYNNNGGSNYNNNSSNSNSNSNSNNNMNFNASSATTRYPIASSPTADLHKNHHPHVLNNNSSNYHASSHYLSSSNGHSSNHLARQSYHSQQQPVRAEDSLRLQMQHDNSHGLSNQSSQHQHQHPHQAHHSSQGGLDDIDSDHDSISDPPQAHISRQSKKQPPSYYYPPQPSASSSKASSLGDAHQKGGSLSAQLEQLVCFPCSIYGKAMMVTIAVEALLVIIMQTVIVVLYFRSLVNEPLPPATIGPNAGVSLPPYLDWRNQSRSIPAYLIVFVFAQLFQLVFAWDAIRAQNTIELIGIVLFNLCCFAYSIFEISQINNSLWWAGVEKFFDPPTKATELQDAVRPLLIVVVCIIGITQCLVTWLAYQLFQEFGWRIYKKIGADPNMKKMYRAYQIYLVLIKVDLFFFVGFSIQFIYLTLVKRTQDPEYWLTIFVLPVTLVILYVAVYAVRHESRRWMATFFAAMLCGVVYFVFKVIRMYYGDKKDNFEGVRKFLTLFASLCLATILLTIANTTLCYRNFGKGLKPHLVRDGRSPSTDTTAQPNVRSLVID